LRPGSKSFSSKYTTFIMAALIAVTGVIMASVLAAGDIGIGGLVAFLPVFVGVIALIIFNPYYGLMCYVHYSFFFHGINRYLSEVPLDLFVDGLLLLTTLSMLFRLNKENTTKLNNGFFFTSVLWLFYTFGEAFNPEAGNINAWLYAVRGISFYAIQTVLLTLLLFDKKEHLDGLLKTIIIWGIFGAFWGWKQINIGLDPFENKWLEDGGGIKHVLSGQLRAFSFFADAGQFGVTMAYVAFICLILALGPYSKIARILYAFGFVVCLIGMSTSGSFEPIFVIFFGFIVYLLMIRNFRILGGGLLVLLIAFSFLKFTNIGNANYQISWIRTALEPNEASLLARMANQENIGEYLLNKPFGSGIGTSGSMAARFYPNSNFTNLPSDSWFLKIWLENGVVGLIIYALGLAFALVMGVVKIRTITDRDTKQKLIALYGGFLGVLVASFGSPVFGQAPLSAIMYVTMTMLTVGEIYQPNSYNARGKVNK
jgi:hypothetical protein